MKRILLWTGVILFGCLLAAAFSFGPRIGMFLSHSTLQYDPVLTIFQGYGGNSILLRSADNSEALIVDTKMFGGAKRLRNLVNSLCADARLTIVNTHLHRDHTGGNALFPGARVIAGAYDDLEWRSETGGEAFPDVRLRPGEELSIRIGNETARIKNYGRAHTRHDTVVYLESRKMLVTGDLVFNTWHPALIERSGTNVREWSGKLGRLMQDYKCKTVVPGHGPVAGMEAIANMKDYFQVMERSVDNKESRAVAKARYRKYYAIPFMSGFKKNLKFIEIEKSRAQAR